jgi:hypothetical protein
VAGNPRGNLAGFTDPSSPGWQVRALERVKQRQKKTHRNSERTSGTLATYDDGLRALLDEACRRRGISRQGYLRRALCAFLAYDLGLPYASVGRYVSTPTTYSAAAAGGRRVRVDDDGTGYGPWKIEQLGEQP